MMTLELRWHTAKVSLEANYEKQTGKWEGRG